MSKPLRIGLVGAGAMGANHARVVTTSPLATLSVLVDPDEERAASLAAHAGAKATTDLAATHECDAVIVASPTPGHAPIALDLIDRGLPLLVEKPLAADLTAAQTIVDAAADQDIPLMCGFVERFNAAVSTAADVLDDTPVHVVSIRHSPPTPRTTTSVVYDLLIHDIDLALRFAGDADVDGVSGATSYHPDTGTAEVADCTLRLTSGAVATLSASRASQRKIRTLLLATPTALIELDLLRQDVTVYRHVREAMVAGSAGYRAETIVDIPFVRHRGEPLALQFEHFVRLVRGEIDPATERSTLIAPHQVAAQLHDASPPRRLALLATQR
jgi:predicted dehydrogenase